jgi:perosamine synthetase
MAFKYPVYQPSLTGNEKAYVNQCLDTGWISSKGEFVARFEQAFASTIGAEYATGVCNGTVAIHLALVALGLGAGDEVLVPTFTYIASVNPIVQVGATPVFVDSEPDTWQLSIEDLKRKLTPNTRAIMVVHLYGHPCDMTPIMAFAKQHNLLVIEDCAEATGSLYNGQHVGTFGDVATFSFFGNKTITCGEGGMVTTNDATLFSRLTRLKGQGLAQHREYWHDVLGFNYRMTNIAAAIGLAQLEQLPLFLERKQAIATAYKQHLQGLPVTVHPAVGSVYHSYWMVSILTEKAQQREPLREHLKAAGIETRPAFYPVHTMPMYATRYLKHPVAEDLASRGLNLPSYPGLTLEDVATICNAIKGFYGHELSSSVKLLQAVLT